MRVVASGQLRKMVIYVKLAKSEDKNLPQIASEEHINAEVADITEDADRTEEDDVVIRDGESEEGNGRAEDETESEDEREDEEQRTDGCADDGSGVDFGGAYPVGRRGVGR